MAESKLHLVSSPATFQPGPYFQHRHNRDGSCDSICLRCYRTVASTLYEDWLAHAESNHTCTPLDLHVWLSDRVEYSI
jgi:hypothetical protein